MSKKRKNGSQSSNEKHISIESTRLWYQSILNKYNTTLSANTSIDNKSGLILAVAVALLVYIAQPDKLSVTVALGGIVLVVDIIMTIVSIHTRDTPTEVSTTQEKESYYNMTDLGFIWQQIADLEKSLKQIEKINSKKNKMYEISVYLLLVSLFFIIIGRYVDIRLIIIR